MVIIVSAFHGLLAHRCDSRVRIIDYFDREVKPICPDSEFFSNLPRNHRGTVVLNL